MMNNTNPSSSAIGEATAPLPPYNYYFMDDEDYMSEDDHQYDEEDSGEDFNYHHSSNRHDNGDDSPHSYYNDRTDTFNTTSTTSRNEQYKYRNEHSNNDGGNSNNNHNNKKILPPPFPVKLHKLLQDANQAGFTDIISWQQEEGRERSCHPFFKQNIYNKPSSSFSTFVAQPSESSCSSFKIHDPDRFANEIMPKYFAQCTKLKSFHRQLNIYGFKRIHLGPFKGGYSHSLFQRLRPELCEQMARKITSRTPARRKKGKPPSASSLLSSSSSSSSSSLLLSTPTTKGRRQQQQQQGGGGLAAGKQNVKNIKSSRNSISSRQQQQQQQQWIDTTRAAASSDLAVSTTNKRNETRDDIMVLKEEEKAVGREKGFRSCSTNNDHIKNKSIDDDTTMAVMMKQQDFFYEKDNTTSSVATHQDNNTTSTSQKAAVLPATTRPFSFSFGGTFARRSKYDSRQEPVSNKMNAEIGPSNSKAVYPDFIPPAYYSPIKHNRPSQARTTGASNTASNMDPTHLSFYTEQCAIDEEQEEEEADLLSFLDQYIMEDDDNASFIPHLKGSPTHPAPTAVASPASSMPPLSNPTEGEQQSQQGQMINAVRTSTADAAASSILLFTTQNSLTRLASISISDEISNDNSCFPHKLYTVLQDAEQNGFDHIISWVEDGNAFKVHDHKAFVEEIMPNYFDQTKYESFRRQLNLYGFKRIGKGHKKGVISHSCFMRSVPSLCQFILRKVVAPVKQGGTRAAAGHHLAGAARGGGKSIATTTTRTTSSLPPVSSSTSTTSSTSAASTSSITASTSYY